MSTATPIHTRKGRYGRIIVWDCGDHHVSTSSADHYLAPASAMNEADDMAALARMLVGRMPADGHVQETVCFEAHDHTGVFYGADELGRHEAAESHLEAIRDAGYDPAPIPDDLKERELT